MATFRQQQDVHEASDEAMDPSFSSLGLGADSSSYNHFVACQCPRGSSASVVSSSTYSSSQRSRRSSNLSASSASTAASSQPSQFTAVTEFARWQLDQATQGIIVGHSDEAAGTDIPRYHLPCDLRWLAGCSEVFPVDNVEGYIQHMGTDHLGWNFPMRTACWWCDDVPFQSQDEKDSVFCFGQRMEHISHHVLHDTHNGFSKPLRIDFHMLDHLRSLDLVSAEIFKLFVGRHELPHPEGVFPSGYRPACSDREMMANSESRDEEKHWRRNKRANAGRKR